MANTSGVKISDGRSNLAEEGPRLGLGAAMGWPLFEASLQAPTGQIFRNKEGLSVRLNEVFEAHNELVLALRQDARFTADLRQRASRLFPAVFFLISLAALRRGTLLRSLVVN